MSLVNDIQSNLAVKPLAALTTFAAATAATNVSASVDTAGFNAAVFAVNSSRALAAADIATFTYKIQTSVDNSVWTDLESDGHLPYRKNTARTFVIAQGGYLQTIGCFSTARYIRLSVTGTADTTQLILTPWCILRSNLVEFTGWDSALNPADGQP